MLHAGMTGAIIGAADPDNTSDSQVSLNGDSVAAAIGTAGTLTAGDVQLVVGDFVES